MKANEVIANRAAELPLGGTAVGTGINAPPRLPPRVIELIRRANPDLADPGEAPNHFEPRGPGTGWWRPAGHRTLRTIAVSLFKIADDIRWLSSGPRTGLAEIRLPDLQPGSSIMPDKVNPVAAEAVCQMCAQIVGNDAAVAFGGAAGNRGGARAGSAGRRGRRPLEWRRWPRAAFSTPAPSGGDSDPDVFADADRTGEASPRHRARQCRKSC